MRRTAAWIAGCLLVVSAGCASMQAGKERRQRTETALDALRYKQSKDEVWLAVRRLIADREFDLAGADAEAVGQKNSGFTMAMAGAKETYPFGSDRNILQRLGIVSSPKARTDGSVSLDTGWRATDDRLHVDGLVEQDGFRVIFTRVIRDREKFEEQWYRDLDMEMALAARLDPEAWQRVERAADGKW